MTRWKACSRAKEPVIDPVAEVLSGVNAKVHFSKLRVPVEHELVERSVSGFPVRGFVVRAEGKRDRRVRVVALTKEGEKLISPAYQRHAILLEHIFEPLSENERLSLENMLKLLGRQAETMGEIPEE